MFSWAWPIGPPAPRVATASRPTVLPIDSTHRQTQYHTHTAARMHVTRARHYIHATRDYVLVPLSATEGVRHGPIWSRASTQPLCRPHSVTNCVWRPSHARAWETGTTTPSCFGVLACRAGFWQRVAATETAPGRRYRGAHAERHPGAHDTRSAGGPTTRAQGTGLPGRCRTRGMHASMSECVHPAAA